MISFKPVSLRPRNGLFSKDFCASAPLFAFVAVMACGSPEDGGETAASGSAAPPAREAASVVATGPDVRDPSAPLDAALADEGESVFTVKACVACHYVGREARLVGPDLAHVTERRTWPWFYGMVTNPDSMTRYDDEARRLLGEYMAPMTKMGLSDEEVRAVWEYLRRHGETEDTR